MKWKDLTLEKQERWNKVADKINNDPFLRFFTGILAARKCYLCRYKFNPILKTTAGFNDFTNEFFFHIKSTHGIPPELMLNIIYEKETIKT